MQDRINMAELAALVAALVNSGGGGGDVTDVQVNGVSVVTDGVANVPVANNLVYGVVKLGSGFGIVNKAVTIASASSSQIKAGINSSYAIKPEHQHESTFYGLAKAAGSDEKDSTLPFGQYTDSAKDKIQQMLGIIEMIAPHEEAQASQAYSIGDAFVFAGKLYRATSAIAIDDAIAPGTNCTQTTLIQLIGGN